ncbi:MAG: TonB family protein [Acidobacteria bacterium]|nr:TonB family protein [Acidobacteriota bacterium]
MRSKLKRDFVFSLILAAGFCVLSFLVFAGLAELPSNLVEAAPGKITQGALQIVGKANKSESQCPLKHTEVKAEISGSLARTTVTQEFQNPFNDKIEAVYVFPLSANAAVDDMTMVVGDRTIKGKIRRREEARQIYEAAREAGQIASLLDQERPNIFTQSVANIAPGATVKVTISYVEALKYEDGAYEFVFPMVVGPRYIPQPSTQNSAPDTSQIDTSQIPSSVPDASRITPPITPEGTRTGHDISIEVKLDAGVPIDSLNTKAHEIEEQRVNAHSAIVRLKDQNTIPNKDFVLRFDVAGKKIADAMMTHRGQSGGFFTLMLQPPERVTVADVSPKEIVFVLDTSGSMNGFPIEKAKEAMKLAIDGMNPQDTFNLITFAGDTHVLFPQPAPATPENLKRAQDFLASRQGSGGTEMMKAIKTALEPSNSQDHLRIVCFMTDGFVGNDMEIVGEIQKHPNARVFAFGIGSSVNRFLLDKMAEQGRGEVEYVSLQDDGSAAAKRFHERVRNPLLTDIRVEWGGLPVADVYPKRIPDLFSAKPLVLTGRYTGGARGVVRLIGRVGAQTFTRDIPVELPESQSEHDVLGTLWARTRIDDLMSQDYSGIQNGSPKDDVEEAITQLGLEYRLMTQFTSFVAVEEMTITEGGQPRRVDVPVEIPEGVNRESLFGQKGDSPFERLDLLAKLQKAPKAAYNNLAAPPPSAKNQASVSPGIARDKTETPLPETRHLSVYNEPLLAGAIKKVMPVYPSAIRASGVVKVRITFNTDGEVEETEILTGHPLLRASVIQAARQWQFKPSGIDGGRIKIHGVLAFRFTMDKNGAPVVAAEAQHISPPLQKVWTKLHPSVSAMIERLMAKGAPTANEATFVQDGKASLEVRLADKTDVAITQLKKLGFVVEQNPQSSKLIIGRLPIEKLEALAGLEFVRYVSPLSRK